MISIKQTGQQLRKSGPRNRWAKVAFWVAAPFLLLLLTASESADRLVFHRFNPSRREAARRLPADDEPLPTGARARNHWHRTVRRLETRIAA